MRYKEAAYKEVPKRWEWFNNLFHIYTTEYDPHIKKKVRAILTDLEGFP